MELDKIDKEILNVIQGDFPISADPYGEIGKKAGISGTEALGRVRGLINRGIVRKIGPFFDAKKMGYMSTLCAVQVPVELIRDAVAVINGFAEVTHNYLRAGKPNLWFTVIAESEDRIERILSEISTKASIGPIHNLPAKKTFKIKVDLKIND